MFIYESQISENAHRLLDLMHTGIFHLDIFFSGDRLTDERVQGAQRAMGNADSAKERLEGFISKTEDFHRLMNFLEVKFLPRTWAN